MGARKAFSGAQEYGQVMKVLLSAAFRSFKSRQGRRTDKVQEQVCASRQIGNLETHQERIKKLNPGKAENVYFLFRTPWKVTVLGKPGAGQDFLKKFV